LIIALPEVTGAANRSWS